MVTFPTMHHMGVFISVGIVTSGSKTASYSFKQEKSEDGIEITLTIDKDIIKFNFEDCNDELEDGIYICYRKTEYKLQWCSIEQIIGIFEKLIIFLYNGAVALGHTKFQQEIKTLIKELLTSFEKGITVMQQYKAAFCSMLKGEGKLEYRHNMYHIFSEGFEHISNIYAQISDAHEKLTDLQKALDEAERLDEYNGFIIENLQATVKCCIEGIELLCECGRKVLRKQLEKPAQKDTSSSRDLYIGEIAIAFVAIERCQMLIELFESAIGNIKEEIQETTTVDAAKITIRKLMSSVPALVSLFGYHRRQLKEINGRVILNYI